MNIKEIILFPFFHPSVSALTFYPPSLEWHKWFLSTLELLSRGNLECLRFGASIAWMPHLLFMASLDLLFFHSGFVVEDRLEPTSHIHDILGSSTKNKTTGQQQNKMRIAWILKYHSWHPRKSKQGWFFLKYYLLFRQSPFLSMIHLYYKKIRFYCALCLDCHVSISKWVIYKGLSAPYQKRVLLIDSSTSLSALRFWINDK